MLLQSEQEKEALKADAAQAKQQLCRYSFVVLLLCAFCLFPNASTCTCCLGNVILKAVKQTKYQSSFTVLNFYPWAIKGWWGISLSTSIHRCTTKCQPLVILENKQCVEMIQITSSVRKTVKGMSRWGCVAAIGTFVLLMNSQEYKVTLSSDSGKADWTVLHSANRDPSCKEAGCSSTTQPITCCPWIKDMI